MWLYLGHGGGASELDWHGWYASETNWENTFAFRAVEMCKKYKNVYLGLGNIAQLFADQDDQNMIPRLKGLLQHDDSATYQFYDKVCYGTDWSMPLMIGRTREYLNAFYEVFDDPLISDEIAAKFFQGNAKKFLGL
jgi:predicted TIM-barrel fold metal-dependent hydrolase